jgi:O-antigen biosynthesis protein
MDRSPAQTAMRFLRRVDRVGRRICRRFVGDARLALQGPAVSVIVLNLNKPDLTERCVTAVWKHRDSTPVELIVVDNGGTPENFAALAAAVRGRCTLLRLEVNRYFGEGNNIAAERARGRYLVFLNNDAFVTAGWLQPLLSQIRSDPAVGYVGPRFIYPDGRLQEVGAAIGRDGHVTQFGKVAPPDPADLAKARDVEYCSAACVLMEREVFIGLGGFSAAYEPAYYEDVDLCRRLTARGYRIVCEPNATVVHLENATSLTPDVFGRTPLRDITELNRGKFLDRWGAGLGTGPETVPGRRPAAPAGSSYGRRAATGAARGKTVVFYTAAALDPGGANQYLLAAALAAAAAARVVIVTEHPYSAMRLGALIGDLGLSAGDCGLELRALADVAGLGPIDRCVVMGGAVPQAMRQAMRKSGPESGRIVHIVRGAGRHGPEPFDPGAAVVAVSQAAVRMLELPAGTVPGPRIEVVAPRLAAPPRRPRPGRTLPAADAPLRIVAVGRFFAAGIPGDPSGGPECRHDKRHDLLIEAARVLRQTHDRPGGYRLDIAGALTRGADHRAHFMKLRALADGLRDAGARLQVRLHPDPEPAAMRALVAAAHVFWHATGAGAVAEGAARDGGEPFGLAVVEAMAEGCVPLVVARGGPAEIVADGVNGLTFATAADLAGLTAALTDGAAAGRYTDLSAAAMARSRDFDGRAFDAAWRRLLAGP